MIVYYIFPAKYRYIPILMGNLIFYGWYDWHCIVILVAVILISYSGGLVLEKQKNRFAYVIFVVALVAVLSFFKYTNFFIENLNLLSGKFGGNPARIKALDIILPVGLSFYVFQSISYLSDVYRNQFPVEHNLVRYGAFVSFFPTILSGPIQKSRKLLPQIKKPSFNSEQAIKGIILFVWGLFEKICVSNRLLQVVNTVFSPDTYLNYNTGYYIVAAISFSIYIYADFSSFFDMARGIAKVMGFDIGKNFLTPYLSTSLAEFWQRWHTSLNDWFVENVYIPLGGSRKGIVRKYLNIMIVFFVSGLWHGAAWHFIAWGVINGILMVIGQFLKPIKSAFYNRIHVDLNCESITFIQRIIVFWLITLTWVFFRNDFVASLHIIRRMVLFSTVHLFVPELWNICGSMTQTALTILFTVIFCLVQCHRKDERETVSYNLFIKQPVFLQMLLLGFIIAISLIMQSATSASVNTQFLYYNF